MPETRVVETVYGKGGLDSTKPSNNIIQEVTAIISDAELAEEAETRALAKVNTIIDTIGSMADAKAFLKRLCKRLIAKGYLP